MELRVALVSLLVILLISSGIEAKKSGGGSRRGSGNSGGWGSKSRTTSRPHLSQSHPPPSNQGASEAQKGQDYRDWAGKLTGAGNEAPKLSGRPVQSNTGSQPGTVGWNVPKDHKPSAPDFPASKATATHTQSGNPYGQQHGSNPYNPSGGYNPPGGYNPSGGYNPPGGVHPPPYSPSSGSHYPQTHGNPPPYTPHNQPYQPYHPQTHGNPPPYQPHSQPYQPYQPPHGGYPSSGHGYNPSVGQPVIIQSSQASKPGIGQIAKEALVFAGVSAGVNAAVNRIIPGGIYGHSGGGGGGGSSSGAVPVSHTQITYNNYYNNGTAPEGVAPASNQNPNVPQPAAPSGTQAPAASVSAPAANSNPNPAPADAQGSSTQNPQQDAAQNNPSPLGFIITNDDILKLSEDLYKKDTNNAFNHITINLQGQKKDDSTNDDAPEHLLTVKPEAYEIPTVKAVLALHDNYQLDVRTKEDVTPEERKEESDLLDEFLKSEVLLGAMKFLAEKGYLPNDIYEFKDALKRIWFSQFKRIDGDASSSGFETVYLAEQFDNEIIGLHNWIYFAKQEEANKINYLGYIKEQKLGSNGAVVKLRSSLNNIIQPVTTIFVGTSPELEMALYTVCFYTRPNNVCPVSLGGSQFMIIANRVNYFGKDIIVSGYPEI